MNTPTEQYSAAKESGGERYSLLAKFWLMIICLSYGTNAADRQLFPTLLSSIRGEFSWSLSDSGLLSTGFTVGLAFVGIPAGIVVDRYSRKLVIVVSMLLYSIFTLTTIYATGFWDMFVYRALTGVGEGMQMAAAFAIVGSFFHTKRTLFLGWLAVAYGTGAFLGPRIAVWLHLSADNWRAPFAWFTCAGVILALLVVVLLPTRFTEHKAVKKSQMFGDEHHNVPERFVNRNVIIGFIGSVINGLAIYGFISLYSVFLEGQLKFSRPDIGAAFSFFGLGGFFAFAGGYLGDRYQNRWVGAGAFVCLALVGYSIFNVATTPTSQSTLTLLIGIASSGFIYSNLLSLLQHSVRPQYIGAASGIFLSAMFGAGAFAGYLMGWLVLHFGWGQAALLQITLLPLVAVIALLCVDPKQLVQVRK